MNIKEKVKLSLEKKIHPTLIKNNILPDKNLGIEIIKLRYDLIEPIVDGIILELKRQYKGDKKRGYKKLSSKLLDATNSILIFKKDLKEIIKICRPFIKAEKKYLKKEGEKK